MRHYPCPCSPSLLASDNAIGAQCSHQVPNQNRKRLLRGHSQMMSVVRGKGGVGQILTKELKEENLHEFCTAKGRGS